MDFFEPHDNNRQFEQAFKLTIEHEGGYQCDPKDTGNWTQGSLNSGELKGTKYGISAASYPEEDIKGLTLERAKQIYYRDYWVPNQLGRHSRTVAILWFDGIINHGHRNANKFMQRALGVNHDGIIGPISMASLAKHQYSDQLPLLFLSQRLKFYTCLSGFNRFGKGWVRRIQDQLEKVLHGTLIE